MKTALSQLPAGWREIWRADLQKNKKQALAVNGLALGLAAAMLAPFLYGVFQASSSGGVHFHVTQFLAMLAGLLAYIVLHLGKTFIANALLGSAFLPNLTTVGYSALPSIINAVIATIVAVPLAAALRLALKKAHFLDKLQPQH